MWRIEQTVDNHCWGQKCYLFSNDADPLGIRYHMMAVTFWKGWTLPQGCSGNPGMAFPPKGGWKTTRWV